MPISYDNDHSNIVIDECTPIYIDRRLELYIYIYNAFKVTKDTNSI